MFFFRGRGYKTSSLFELLNVAKGEGWNGSAAAAAAPPATAAAAVAAPPSLSPAANFTQANNVQRVSHEEELADQAWMNGERGGAEVGGGRAEGEAHVSEGERVEFFDLHSAVLG